MAKMDKKRLNDLMTIHSISVGELDTRGKISDEQLRQWLNDEIEFQYDTEQLILSNAHKIDMDERKAVSEEMGNMGIKKTKLAENTNVKEGHFRMWLSGQRNIPVEQERKIYDNFDKIKEAFESVG